jgi:hypothetical protein
LTPDAYFDAPARDQEARKQAKKQPAVVLTVPAPSGMSCGMWLPIWILVAIFSGSSRSAVAVGGAAGVSVRTGSNYRTPLIVAGVFFGLVILGTAAQHPWLLVVLVPMIGAGGFFFWKQKSAQDRKDQELREQYRRDVVADRADYEDKLNAQGDPRGTYGRYPPPE